MNDKYVMLEIIGEKIRCDAKNVTIIISMKYIQYFIIFKVLSGNNYSG